MKKPGPCYAYGRGKVNEPRDPQAITKHNAKVAAERLRLDQDAVRWIAEVKARRPGK